MLGIADVLDPIIVPITITAIHQLLALLDNLDETMLRVVLGVAVADKVVHPITSAFQVVRGLRNQRRPRILLSLDRTRGDDDALIAAGPRLHGGQGRPRSPSGVVPVGAVDVHALRGSQSPRVDDHNVVPLDVDVGVVHTRHLRVVPRPAVDVPDVGGGAGSQAVLPAHHRHIKVVGLGDGRGRHRLQLAHDHRETKVLAINREGDASALRARVAEMG